MYTDFLTKIKNAQSAGKDRLKTIFSSFDMAIAELLVANGYLESATKKGRAPKRIIEIRFNRDGKGQIRHIRFISRPSRRIYLGHRDLQKIRSTHGGIVVLSTPKGVMRARDAIKAKVGGELLFEVW